MDLKLNELIAESGTYIQSYSDLRHINTCEGQFMSQFIWSNFYNTKYYQSEHYIFFIMYINGEASSCMPLCKIEDIPEAFETMQDFFNTNLNTKLKIYLSDEIFLEELKKIPEFEEKYTFEECREYFDYIYDAEKLKTLSGKKYHKKKNHLNSFLKEYSNRYVYKELNCDDLEDVEKFYEVWQINKKSEDTLNRLEDEAQGIYKVLNNCGKLDVKIGGVYVDNKLQAFSIGSYSENLKRAFIHIEKANPEIRGLYNFINQQFLIHSFPEAITVNREDDMGLEGLRQSKMSYNPIELIKKYNIFEK